MATTQNNIDLKKTLQGVAVVELGIQQLQRSMGALKSASVAVVGGRWRIQG